MNPITNPITAHRVKGWPRRPNTPKPAIQNAEVPLSNADSLLGMYWMAQVFKPLLTNTMKKPAMVTWRHSIKRVGSRLPPQNSATSASSTPAVTNRIPANSAAGRLPTAIFVNIKDDPHTK